MYFFQFRQYSTEQERQTRVQTNIYTEIHVNIFSSYLTACSKSDDIPMLSSTASVSSSRRSQTVFLHSIKHYTKTQQQVFQS